MFELEDKIAFYCGGRGRGGHNVAFCKVIKINKKSIKLEEIQGSYNPGGLWNCNTEWLLDNLVSRGMCHSSYNVKF